jgi:outer membrane protein assembly factor BamB
LIQKSITIGILILFVISTIPPLVISDDVLIKKDIFQENFPYYLSDEHGSTKLKRYEELLQKERQENEESLKQVTSYESPIPIATGPMDSPWPMHGYDNRSTGRSPYNTSDTTNLEKWRFYIGHAGNGGAVIDDEGIIYFCDTWGHLYAIYPNGTKKWKVDLNNWGACDFGNSPALDDNGVLYVGGHDNGLFAVSSNGTVLWRHGWGVASSPVIGPDGIIYCTFYIGSPWEGILNAFYSNGTIKWSFRTDDVIQSSPAIGLDGNIIFGSHDGFVYSVYPHNGTLKWKYNTGSWVHGSPTIGADGTIYVGSDNGYLYALYPDNGTLKWKCSTGAMRSSPSLDKEGTLYFGTTNERFWAVYPNGTIKWIFTPKKYSGIWGSTAAISDDGVIYFGFEKRYYYPEGRWIFALDLNGTELWRKTISHDFISSSPCIGPDGTVYIGSEWAKRIGPGNSWTFPGYLHAFGPIESNEPPEPPIITGDSFGFEGRAVDHWFRAYDPDNNPVRLYVDWGDYTYTNWTREYASGERVVMEHTWQAPGNYTITAKAMDVLGEESDWGSFIYDVGGKRLKRALLFGKIYDYQYVSHYDEIHFKAENLLIVTFFPFSYTRYTSGEKIIIVSRGWTIIWESNFWFGFINGYLLE